MDDRSWEIYTLSDPRTQQVRYVGVTVNAQQRFMGHLRRARYGTKTHCAHWIRSLISQSLTPILAVIERGAGKSRTAAERQWIALYRSTCDLTNLTDGGDGMPGCKVSPATRAKMAAAARNRSPEWRAKLSAAGKGRIFTAEWRAKMSVAKRNMTLTTRTKIRAARLGKHATLETRAKMSAAARNRWMKRKAITEEK